MQKFLFVAVVLWSVLLLAQVRENEASRQTYETQKHPPCRGTSMPPKNTYISHRIYDHQWEGCEVKETFETKDIMDNYMMNIHSPNYPENYDYNRLVYYNLTCGEGYFMTLKVKDFQLEEPGDINKREVCTDYVSISAPNFGSDVILCGRHKHLKPIDIHSGRAFITFRTNSDKNTVYRGFNINVFCHKIHKTSAIEANCKSEFERPEQVQRLSLITARLFQLHHIFSKGAYLLSDAEFREMLTLAIKSERACNPIAKAVGAEVLKLFPEEFVKHYKSTSTSRQEEPDYSDA